MAKQMEALPDQQVAEVTADDALATLLRLQEEAAALRPHIERIMKTDDAEMLEGIGVGAQRAIAIDVREIGKALTRWEPNRA